MTGAHVAAELPFPLRRLCYDTIQVDEKDEPGASPLAGELAAFSLNADGQPDVLQFLGRKFFMQTTMCSGIGGPAGGPCRGLPAV
jgi:hypothetical protein